MTYDMVRISLDGFPVQYDERVVQHLNQVSGAENSISNNELREIGRGVSPNVIHTMHGKTDDRYEWFGRLEYEVQGARVAVLFPWHQDWTHPETKMDRSINVYSDRELPRQVVGDLLENIAYQMTLFNARK